MRCEVLCNVWSERTVRTVGSDVASSELLTGVKQH